VTRIERRIKIAHPEVKRVFVEAQARDAHRNSQEPLETLPDDEDRPAISFPDYALPSVTKRLVAGQE
jgi:hypothetical protein